MPVVFPPAGSGGGGVDLQAVADAMGDYDSAVHSGGVQAFSTTQMFLPANLFFCEPDSGASNMALIVAFEDADDGAAVVAFQCPTSWSNGANVSLVWAGLDAGDVRWSAAYRELYGGVDAAADFTLLGDFTASAAATPAELVLTPAPGHVPVIDGAHLQVQITRLGTHVADTVAAQVMFMGILLERRYPAGPL